MSFYLKKLTNNYSERVKIEKYDVMTRFLFSFGTIIIITDFLIYLSVYVMIMERSIVFYHFHTIN